MQMEISSAEVSTARRFSHRHFPRPKPLLIRTYLSSLAAGLSTHNKYKSCLRLAPLQSAFMLQSGRSIQQGYSKNKRIHKETGPPDNISDTNLQWKMAALFRSSHFLVITRVMRTHLVSDKIFFGFALTELQLASIQNRCSRIGLYPCRIMSA